MMIDSDNRRTPSVLEVADSGRAPRARLGLRTPIVFDLRTIILVLIAIAGAAWVASAEVGKVREQINRTETRGKANAAAIAGMPTREEIRHVVRTELAEGLTRVRFNC